MTTINQRDYYPFYTQDTLLEVSDEVAEALADAEKLERNHIAPYVLQQGAVFPRRGGWDRGVGGQVPYSFAGCGSRHHGAALSLVQGSELPAPQSRRIETHS